MLSHKTRYVDGCGSVKKVWKWGIWHRHSELGNSGTLNTFHFSIRFDRFIDFVERERVEILEKVCFFTQSVWEIVF